MQACEQNDSSTQYRSSLIDRKSTEPSKRSASTVEMHRNNNSYAATTSSTDDALGRTVARTDSTQGASRVAPSLRYIRKCYRDKVTIFCSLLADKSREDKIKFSKHLEFFRPHTLLQKSKP